MDEVCKNSVNLVMVVQVGASLLHSFVIGYFVVLRTYKIVKNVENQSWSCLSTKLYLWNFVSCKHMYLRFKLLIDFVEK